MKPKKEQLLRPCPFCGGKLSHEKDDSKQWIECGSCGLVMLFKGTITTMDVDKLYERVNRRPAHKRGRRTDHDCRAQNIIHSTVKRKITERDRG